MRLHVYGFRGIPSTYGGFETFATYLLPELARRGHEVTVHCRGKGGPATFEGVSLEYAEVTRRQALETLHHGAIASFKIARTAAAADALLVFNVANAPYAAFAAASGRAVVLNVDGVEWWRSKWSASGRAYFRAAARLAARSRCSLIADSAGMRDVYLREVSRRSRLTVIPYPYRDSIPSAVPVLQSKFGLTAASYAVASGRIVPENQLALIAEAYLDSGREEPLVVLGGLDDSQESQRLRHLAAAAPARVRLVGHVADPSDYARLVASSSVYVHGHTVGGTNPALVEAMHLGARVLAADTSFNREALGLGGHFWRTQRDLSALLDECTLVFDRDATMSKAHDHYRGSDIVDAYEELLLAAAASRGSSVQVPTRWG